MRIGPSGHRTTYILPITLGLGLVLATACKPRDFNQRAHSKARSSSSAPGDVHPVVREFNYHGLYTFDPKTALRFDDLKALLEGRKPKSVEELLALMGKDERFGVMLSEPVLVYASRSAEQKAVSPLTPRIVMGGGTFFMATTGGLTEHKDAENKVQILDFDLKTLKFRPFEISFSGAGPSIDSSPKTCASCHGTEIQPIWSNYRRWSGTYASFQDKIFARDHTAEAELFKKYMCTNSASGRYRHIASVPEEYKESFDAKECVDTSPQSLKSITIHANGRMSGIVSHFNYFRAHDDLQSAPAFPKYQYVIRALLQGCEGFASFFPNEAQARAELDQFEKKQLAILNAYLSSENEFDKKALPGRGSDFYNLPVTMESNRDIFDNALWKQAMQLRFAAQKMGVDFRRWTSAFSPRKQDTEHDFVMDSANGSVYETAEYLSHFLEYPERKATMSKCETLREKSVEALSRP